MLMNSEKKIQALKDQINNLKKRPSSIYGSGHALSDSEKEGVLERENKWKEKRITEMLQEVRRLKGK